jgi:hypothetical protein
LAAAAVVVAVRTLRARAVAPVVVVAVQTLRVLAAAPVLTRRELRAPVVLLALLLVVVLVVVLVVLVVMTCSVAQAGSETVKAAEVLQYLQMPCWMAALGPAYLRFRGEPVVRALSQKPVVVVEAGRRRRTASMAEVGEEVGHHLLMA